ncbi:MAG: hypothetical protein RLZ98_2118 [Pseudomonadota bacterium]
MVHNAALDIQRITCPEDLQHLQFYDDMAAVVVPLGLLETLPLKNETRGESPRLEYVEEAIRREGYDCFEPIIVRIGRRGNWVIVNGGHRITAARNVSKEFWTNLWGPKVKELYFLVYRTSISDSLRDESHVAAPPPHVV